METTELDYKKDIMRKLVDIKNSQERLIEKIAHVQVDLFNHPDKALEEKLNQMNTDVSNEFELIGQVIEDYEMQINRL